LDWNTDNQKQRNLESAWVPPLTSVLLVVLVTCTSTIPAGKWSVLTAVSFYLIGLSTWVQSGEPSLLTNRVLVNEWEDPLIGASSIKDSQR
jgi:hypothetical protein